MKIDIWTDIVCPFCYLGRRRLEAAVGQFQQQEPDAEVEITWHSFELDRNSPAVAEQSLIDLVTAKYGADRDAMVAQHEAMAGSARELGLEFNWQQAKYGNTFDAHRLVHFAADRGLADEAHERLMRAYFTEGRAVGDRSTLVEIADETGLERTEVAAMLASDGYGNHVRSDEATAKMLGITAVPFFVFDRKYGVSGAQPVEAFTQALQTAWDTRHEQAEPVAVGCGGGCGPDGCGGACAR